MWVLLCVYRHKRKVWAEHAACEVYMQMNGIINTEAIVRDGMSSNSVQGEWRYTAPGIL